MVACNVENLTFPSLFKQSSLTGTSEQFVWKNTSKQGGRKVEHKNIQLEDPTWIARAE